MNWSEFPIILETSGVIFVGLVDLSMAFVFVYISWWFEVVSVPFLSSAHL